MKNLIRVTTAIFFISCAQAQSSHEGFGVARTMLKVVDKLTEVNEICGNNVEAFSIKEVEGHAIDMGNGQTYYTPGSTLYNLKVNNQSSNPRSRPGSFSKQCDVVITADYSRVPGDGAPSYTLVYVVNK